MFLAKNQTRCADTGVLSSVTWTWNVSTGRSLTSLEPSSMPRILGNRIGASGSLVTTHGWFESNSTEQHLSVARYHELPRVVAFTAHDAVELLDGVIVRGCSEDYTDQHPLFDEVGLVVEVAETTLVTDRYVAEPYAQAQIPAYWLINLVDGCVEVMTHPKKENDKFAYADCIYLKRGEILHLILGG
ncbi:MAG TPA: hypothetical protein DDZ51_10985 [Planctomycetaceae bacterium]|nr:hypothetical protein [Planctomycetaceae bacterium]